MVVKIIPDGWQTSFYSYMVDTMAGDSQVARL